MTNQDEPRSIGYSDGQEVEREVYSLIDQADSITSMDWIGRHRHVHETIRYHLSADRANLLRPFNFSGLDVLELGAGMGAVSRFLAENARSLTSVEGTTARFRALERRMSGLANWKGAVSNIQDFSTEERFDVVVVVGVMEYSELYIQAPDPFRFFMSHAAGFLREDGVLILAIENQHGIKYWAGAPEDHTRRMFDGLCGYGTGPSVRTFNRSGLQALFSEAGLANVEEFYPWPDYKHVSTVVSNRLVNRLPELAGELAADALMREPDLGVRYFPESLAIVEAARDGSYQDLANSFLFVGSRTIDSQVKAKLLANLLEKDELAWHYALERKSPIVTFIRGEGEKMVSEKVHLGGSNPEAVAWKNPGVEPVLTEPRVSTQLANHAYFGDLDKHDTLLDSFIQWAFEHWSDGSGGLKSSALDAIATNAVATKDGSFTTFDHEWEWPEPVNKSWFVLRNLWAVRYGLMMFPDLPYTSVKDAYEKVCQRLGVNTNYEADLARKVRLHLEVSMDQTEENVAKNFHHWLELPFPPHLYARDYTLESTSRLRAVLLVEENWQLKQQLEAQRLEIHRLNAELSRKAVRVAMAADKALRRIPGVDSALSSIARTREKD